MTAQHYNSVNDDNEVHHPKHYNSHPSGIECVEYEELLPGNLAHACVYVWRYKDKGTPKKDLDKALWFLNRERGRTFPERRHSALHLGVFLEEEKLPTEHGYYAERIRIYERLRHLQRFIDEKEFIASTVALLLGYRLDEAISLITAEREKLSL